jgi:hypothetical protein
VQPNVASQHRLRHAQRKLSSSSWPTRQRHNQGLCVDRDKLNEARTLPEKLLGMAPVVLMVWAALVGAALYLGVRVVGAAASPTWPVLLAFALLVITVLRTA